MPEKKVMEAKNLKSERDDRRLEELYYDLDNSKTSHHRSASSWFHKKDSEEYTAVKDRLRFVVQNLQGNFSADSEANDQMTLTVAQGYYRLINACQNYLAKGGGKTTNGRIRKEKIQQILETAQEDIMGIKQAMSDMKRMPKEQQAQLNWKDILHSARAATLEVEDFNDDENYIFLGNVAKTEDERARLMDQGVFSKEVVTPMEDTLFIGNAFNTSSKSSSMEKFFHTNDSFHLSNRNVATSVVAGLIGAQNLVEESKTVKVHDKKSDQIIKGNLMSKAKGEDAKKVAERFYDDVAKKTDNMEKRSEGVKSLLAPSIQKELSSLQVLDYLCGQGDRNYENYFLEYDEEKKQYTHVHGIDNDMSFGSGVEYEEHIKNHDGYSMTKLRMVVDKDDNLVIPHMDIQLAQNIKNLSEDELRFALKDLIEAPFIETAVKRLEKLKHAIIKEESKKDSKVFLKEEDWGKDTHTDFLNHSRAKRSEELLKQKGLQKELYEKGTDYISQMGTQEQKDYLYEVSLAGSYYDELAMKMMGYKAGNTLGDGYFMRDETPEVKWEASVEAQDDKAYDEDNPLITNTRKLVDEIISARDKTQNVENIINLHYASKDYTSVVDSRLSYDERTKYARIKAQIEELAKKDLYDELSDEEIDYLIKKEEQLKAEGPSIIRVLKERNELLNNLVAQHGKLYIENGACHH